MRIINNVLRTAQNLGGGADSIENYLSQIWGDWRPPKLAGGKPHDGPLIKVRAITAILAEQQQHNFNVQINRESIEVCLTR